MNKANWKQWVFLAMLLAVLVFPQSAVAEGSQGSVLDEVRSILSGYHVSNVSEEELADAAITGMIDSLGDPYTEYMNGQQWQGFQNTLEQNYVGIGIRLGEDERGVYVVEVFPNSPASAAGVLPGDYISGVNHVSAAGKSSSELVDLIKGEEYTSVNVTFVRDGKSTTYEMPRKSVQIPVVSGQWLPQGYGYIAIDTFSSDADDAFIRELSAMKQQGMKGLIIDLRANPGGYLDTARNIASQFIEAGVLIHTRDRDGTDNPVLIIDGSSVAFPVVLLVNGQSASASEVLAGALQDYGAATIVGTKTFGKGSVQSIFSLSNGGMLKTTIEEYLTPLKHEVNHVGIKPDVEVVGNGAQLLQAFYELGITEMTVAASNEQTIINGVSFADRIPYIIDKGRIYVHSRVLAALGGLQVTWNEKEMAVQFSGRNTFAYTLDSPQVIARNSITYIDAANFSEHVRGLQAVSTDSGITLTIKGQ